MLTAAARPLPDPGRRRAVPSFVLYGETGAHPPDLLHVETLAARSHRYGWVIAPHTHPGLHQVLWIESGRARLRLDETRFGVDGPAVVVVPAGVVHGFGFSPGVEGMVMTIGARRLLAELDDDPHARFGALFDAPRTMSPPHGAATRRIASLAAALVTHAPPGPGSASPVPGWLARSLLWTVAGSMFPDAPPGREPVGGTASARVGRTRPLARRFRALVDAHHVEHWPVTRYASALGASVAQLNRACREVWGCSALEVVHGRLAAEARRRLLQVEAPVARVADELGFRDPSYFCRFFRRISGESPRAWRRRHGR